MAESYRDAVRKVQAEGRVRIISHHDADGIFSAAILSTCLLKEGISFQVSLVKGLDEPLIEKLNEEKNKLVIIADMGSGDIDLVDKLDSKVIILDHHKLQTETTKALQINPHLAEMNGGDVLCGSLLSFLFAIAMDEKYWALAYLALAGAIGDKQHLGGFKSANARILEKAVEKGEISVRRALLLEGESKDAIVSSIDPYFGFDNTDAVEKMLTGLGITLTENIEELGQKKTELLTSALTLRLIEQGARTEALENLVGDILWSEKINRSLNSLAEDVNACGRVREEAVGLQYCYGDREAEKKVRSLRKDYEEKIMTNIRKLKAEKSFKKENIQFFYCGEPRIAGALAGIGMLYFLDQKKATFALTVLEKKTKVSCRGTKYLVDKGLDLALACKEGASSVGGKGGGHSIASGALIPRGQEEKFLEIVDGLVGEQYAKRAGQT